MNYKESYENAEFIYRSMGEVRSEIVVSYTDVDDTRYSNVTLACKIKPIKMFMVGGQAASLLMGDESIHAKDTDIVIETLLEIPVKWADGTVEAITEYKLSDLVIDMDKNALFLAAIIYDWKLLDKIEYGKFYLVGTKKFIGKRMIMDINPIVDYINISILEFTDDYGSDIKVICKLKPTYQKIIQIGKMNIISPMDFFIMQLCAIEDKDETVEHKRKWITRARMILMKYNLKLPPYTVKKFDELVKYFKI